jgi:hypothetical protein
VLTLNGVRCNDGWNANSLLMEAGALFGLALSKKMDMVAFGIAALIIWRIEHRGSAIADLFRKGCK